MIDIPALRELVEAGEARVAFDVTGVILEAGDVSASGSAVLVASPLTEAVKVVADGLVHESLDRDTIWSVDGFVLGRDVLAALEAGVTTAGELIEAVTRAGFEWRVISPSSSST